MSFAYTAKESRQTVNKKNQSLLSIKDINKIFFGAQRYLYFLEKYQNLLLLAKQKQSQTDLKRKATKPFSSVAFQYIF